MKFYPNQSQIKLLSQKRFFKQIDLKKKKSYKKINNFSINFDNNILQDFHFKESSTNLESYKELVKSFLIKHGKSKRLQNLTFKSLVNLWKHYPHFSLKNNINRFFFLYPFPLILKTTFPIFRKRRSKRSKKSVQWLNSISERKYTFNFFKDFLKQDLTRDFGSNFVLTFMQLSSKRVSLLKTQQTMSIKLYDFWRHASKTRKWKAASKKKELGNLTEESKYTMSARALLHFKIKPFQRRFYNSREAKGNFLSLNFLPGFPKKNLWKKHFFLNNNLFSIKVNEGITFTKSMIFLLKRKRQKFLELQRLKKKFLKRNFTKIKKNFSTKLLNKKGKRLVKIQSYKKTNNLVFLKQELKHKRKKYFHKWALKRILTSKSIYIKKDLSTFQGKTIRNKLFYNFLVHKYISTENVPVKEVNISWYLSIKKKLLFTLFTFDKKSLCNMDKNFSKVYKTFFNVDSVLLKTYPLKKITKVQTLLKSPHVNKKAQQHFSKIEYSKTYSFTFDSNKISIEKVHLLLNRLITLNFINIKFKVQYSYK